MILSFALLSHVLRLVLDRSQVAVILILLSPLNVVVSEQEKRVSVFDLACETTIRT